MRRNFIIAIIIMMAWSVIGRAQSDEYEFFYKRSSLEMAYIESDDFPDKEYVDALWNNYLTNLFPSQYNNHGVGINTIDLSGISLSDSELSSLKNKSDEDAVTGMKIEKYIKKKKIANKLIQRWFMYNKNANNPDECFDMQLIFDRGLYNDNSGANDVDLLSRKRNKKVVIQDAGEQLIPFTFMTFTKLSFYKNEPVAAVVRDAAVITAKALYDNAVQNGANLTIADIAYKAAVLAAQVAYEATKDGYTLKSVTWLYRLRWDEDAEDFMYDEVWANPKLIETTNSFSLDYVDCQKNSSIVLISANKSARSVIDLTVVRNIDNVFNKLQKRNDEFKVMTEIEANTSLSDNFRVPVQVIDGVITAQIGTKEGLRGGEKFRIYDPEKDKFVGKATAIVGKVWDNADYGPNDDPQLYEPQIDKKGNSVVFTSFKGKAKKIKEGMVLVDPKTSKKSTITARIGTKEGVEKGDAFDVFTFKYKNEAVETVKVGRVKAVDGMIWDNRYYGSPEELSQVIENTTNTDSKKKQNFESFGLKKRDKNGLRVVSTTFKGSSKVLPGMWLRKAK